MIPNDYLAAILGFLALLTGAGFVGLWMNVGSRIAKAEAKGDQANLLASQSVAGCGTIGKELQDYRVELTTRIVRVQTLAEANVVSLRDAEIRLSKAIEAQAEAFREIAKRLDRYFELAVSRAAAANATPPAPA